MALHPTLDAIVDLYEKVTEGRKDKDRCAGCGKDGHATAEFINGLRAMLWTRARRVEELEQQVADLREEAEDSEGLLRIVHPVPY